MKALDSILVHEVTSRGENLAYKIGFDPRSIIPLDFLETINPNI
jgi:hypothetical protein